MARTAGSSAEVTGPRIRAAALALFARHGYAAVSMRQIAREVGLQAGALYLYTPDKQTLLANLLASHMSDLLASIAALPRQHDPVAALEQFVRFHIRYHHERADEVFISYMELRNLTPENFAMIEDLRRDYETILQKIIEQGRDAGLFDVPDSKLAALAVIAMLTGVNTWYDEGGRLSLDRVADIYCAMVLRAVGASPPAGTGPDVD